MNLFIYVLKLKKKTLLILSVGDWIVDETEYIEICLVPGDLYYEAVLPLCIN